MQMNSVILKEESPWIEYYYRSLKPGVHYLPFSTAQELTTTLRMFRDLTEVRIAIVLCDACIYQIVCVPARICTCSLHTVCG